MNTVLPSAAQPQDQVADLLAADRIEAAHRLVEDDHLRVVHQRLRDADALQHALRVGAEARVGRVARDRPARAARSTRARALRRRDTGEPRVEVERARGRSGSRRSTGSRAGSRRGAATAGLAHVAGRGSSPSPAVGRISPISILIVVVLPAPLGPTKPKISPSRTLERDPVQHALHAQAEARAEVLDDVARPTTSAPSRLIPRPPPRPASSDELDLPAAFRARPSRA